MEVALQLHNHAHLHLQRESLVGARLVSLDPVENLVFQLVVRVDCDVVVSQEKLQTLRGESVLFGEDGSD